MNHLMICAIFMILSLHFESLSSQFQGQNSFDDKQILEESFKEKLLKELGLSSAPNVSALKAPEIPAIYKYLVEAENRKIQEPVEKNDDFHAKTERIFLFPEAISLNNLAGHGKNYAFKLNSLYLNLDIKSASLWFHISGDPQFAVKTGDDPQVLNLYKAFKAPGKEIRSRELFHSDKLNKTGWYSVEVSGLVKEWLYMHTKSDLSLDVVIKGAISLEVSGVDGEAAHQWLTPFLVLDTEEKKQLYRKRRNAIAGLPVAGECDPKPPKTCCRHNLVINLYEMGFHFILYPERVNLYACAGSCQSHAFHSHGVRASIFRRMNRNLEHHTCCRPNKLGAMSVIYFLEDETVLMKTIPDVQVLSCSCFI